MNKKAVFSGDGKEIKISTKRGCLKPETANFRDTVNS